VGYDHVFGLPNGDSLVPHVGFHYEARSWLSYYNETAPVGGVTDWDQQKAYTRTDASLIYRAGGDYKFEIEGFVRNIENKNIKANSDIYQISQVNYPTAIYQPPRTFGAKVRYRF
jgi:outer membrane receptor protein involved in Fe transport